MHFIAESSLHEYATTFWFRQEQKPYNKPCDQKAIADIKNGGNPVEWLLRNHNYKLPKISDPVVQILSLDTEDDVQNWVIHDYMVNDD